MGMMYGQFFRSRPYRGDDDRAALLDLVSQANLDHTRPPYWHVGDVLWQMYRGPSFDPTANVRLWHLDDGTHVGFAWRDGAGSAVLQQHPSAYRNPLLEEAMLLWIAYNWNEPKDDGKTRALTTYARDSDHERIERLKQHGFAVTDDYLMCRFAYDCSIPIRDTAPPRSAVIRPIHPDSELPERVALHRDVWANSAVTPDSYRRMRSVPGYLPDLDIVAVLPDGAFAAYCICWFDPISKTGEFEPVGTRATYRQQGLGKAVIDEGLRRLHTHGATTAIVHTPATNSAAQALYLSAGFRITDRERAYRKTWADTTYPPGPLPTPSVGRGPGGRLPAMQCFFADRAYRADDLAGLRSA